MAGPTNRGSACCRRPAGCSGQDRFWTKAGGGGPAPVSPASPFAPAVLEDDAKYPPLVPTATSDVSEKSLGGGSGDAGGRLRTHLLVVCVDWGSKGRWFKSSRPDNGQNPRQIASTGLRTHRPSGLQAWDRAHDQRFLWHPHSHVFQRPSSTSFPCSLRGAQGAFLDCRWSTDRR